MDHRSPRTLLQGYLSYKNWFKCRLARTRVTLSHTHTPLSLHHPLTLTRCLLQTQRAAHAVTSDDICTHTPFVLERLR